eukprot:4211930-Ditylum_brightwellii.AAC.1
MHRPNRTHNTKDCFELKWRTTRVKASTSRAKTDKAAYKDLNTFVNGKVTKALKSQERLEKDREKITINAFDKFCSLNVDSSDEERYPEVNALAATNNNDSDSTASHVPSEDSKSDVK